MNSQALIYISLGFIAASLLAVLLNKFIFRKAYKKAAKDLRGQIPLNQAEMTAERDRLRAEYAISLNKLEYKVAAMQESELGLRIQSTKDLEYKQQANQGLEDSIKQSIKWEHATDTANQEINILKAKLEIQTTMLADMQSEQAKYQIEQLELEKAQKKYDLAEADYQKSQNERKEVSQLLTETGKQLDKMTIDLELNAVELTASRKNNIIYEAKISELSTEMLFLSQELFAKKISLDLSERSIDKYKNKLLTQKLAMRDASIKDKAIYALKSKLDGTSKLNLNAEKPEGLIAKRPNFTSINTLNISKEVANHKDLAINKDFATNDVSLTAKPKLVHDVAPKAPTNSPKKVTSGLRGRMNSIAKGAEE